MIHACYRKDTGALRVTDPDTNQPKGCTDKEVALDWNAAGATDAYWNSSTGLAQVFPGSWRLHRRVERRPRRHVPVHGEPDCEGDERDGLAAAHRHAPPRRPRHATNNDFYYNYSSATVASDANGDTMVGTIALSIGRTIGAAGGTISVQCVSPMLSQVSSVMLWAVKLGKLH